MDERHSVLFGKGCPIGVWPFALRRLALGIDLHFATSVLESGESRGVRRREWMKTEIQYYHRIVVVVLVSTAFPIPLVVRFQKNGEAEVACALALLQDLVGQLGRRFLDVLVGDALYLQAPFVK